MTLAPFSARQRGGQIARGRRSGWDPAREIDDFIRTFFGGGPAGGDPAAIAAALRPPVDIEETEQAYVVDVDLPNVSPERIELQMRGEELRISGTFEERERSGVMRRQNRQTGEFEYLVDLPNDIDGDRVEAAYDNGVLTVTVARARSAQPRRIEIERGRKRGG
ncbi:Hsp20/alpha crystallin family protein [Dactylosporangium sp. AC04546]|uniref:Hsp20/alpha crystallin family protein n=1 Tax=Dactylosporangium sp. AC04546 TaxID=2862460 RepID=UPI001EDF55E2|nr:Hsp20/alpha crystallin family protein [Dactylosporangium sp. AC04546]WVK88380.1 Hsp20/alpha crystallin family protein [Dactylosporangium sp. AC04546]